MNPLERVLALKQNRRREDPADHLRRVILKGEQEEQHNERHKLVGILEGVEAGRWNLKKRKNGR